MIELKSSAKEMNSNPMKYIKWKYQINVSLERKSLKLIKLSVTD